MLDSEVDHHVVVGNSLGKYCPWALCEGYANYCLVVDLGNDCRNIGNRDYYGNLDNLWVPRSCYPYNNGDDLGGRGSVHSCG